MSENFAILRIIVHNIRYSNEEICSFNRELVKPSIRFIQKDNYQFRKTFSPKSTN